MLHDVALTLCISYFSLVFLYAEPTHGEPIHGDSNTNQHGNFTSTRTVPQANSCKLDTSHLKQNNSCQTKTFKDADILKFKEEAHKKVETLENEKFFQEFQKEVLLKRERMLKSKTFQADVSAFKKPLNENIKDPGTPKKSLITTPGELYIFVSFSLGEKALLNLAQDAKKWGATLVLRGFKEGTPRSSAREPASGLNGRQGYTETAQALQKIIQETEQGFIIEPELFSLFAINAVPTFILTKPFQLQAMERTQTPIHDRIQGHVSARYALESFAKDGDLKEEAKSLLLKGESK